MFLAKIFSPTGFFFQVMPLFLSLQFNTLDISWIMKYKEQMKPVFAVLSFAVEVLIYSDFEFPMTIALFLDTLRRIASLLHLRHQVRYIPF